MSKPIVVITTPQFHNPKGAPALPPPPRGWTAEDWAEFRSSDALTLREQGFKTWCDPYEDDWPHQGKTLILFPGDWYDHIPEGMEVVSISGEAREFRANECSDDIRFGCLAYGVLV